MCSSLPAGSSGSCFFWAIFGIVGLGLIFLSASFGMAVVDRYHFLERPAFWVAMFLIFAGPATLALIIGYRAPAASGQGPALSVVFGVVTGLTLLLGGDSSPPYWYIPLQHAVAVAVGASLGGFLHHWMSRRQQPVGQRTVGPTAERPVS